MRRWIFTLFLVVLALPAQAAKHAFVLGNAGYEQLSHLLNTHEDARAYGAAFGDLGYKVHYHQDLDLDGTLQALDAFLTAVGPGDEVVFVYSGHGWSDGQTNYLIPVDAPKSGSDRILKRQSVALRNGLNGVIDELENIGVGLTVAIIDACRNNPFESPAGRKSFGMSRGLAPVKAATGTFVIFSAGEGQEALDRLPSDPPGPQMSVFTRTFLPHLRAGMFLEDAISRAQVETASLALDQLGHLQHPAYYDQTLGDTCLTGKCGQAAPVPQTADLCQALYDEAKSAPSCFTFEGYAAACPTHRFLPIAQSYLKRNCQAPATATVKQTPTPEPKTETARANPSAPVSPTPKARARSYAGIPSVVRLGALLGFTGPIESLTGPMGDAVEAAATEATATRGFLGGVRVETARGDSTCIDAQAATVAAKTLIDRDKVHGIVGADCSGVTAAVLKDVTLEAGMVMISPSATSPGLSGWKTDGFFYRMAPSDARFGDVLAAMLGERRTQKVAVTFTDNDYGQGQKDAFEAAFAKAGGTITVALPHEDGRDASYYRNLTQKLAAPRARDLVILGYADQGGGKILEQAAKTNSFDAYHLGDGMFSTSVLEQAGAQVRDGTLISPTSHNQGIRALEAAVGDKISRSPFAPESYDAAAVLLLAMQAAGSVDPSEYKEFLVSVANAPGEKILPGQLGRAFEILHAGGEIDYVGASDVELFDNGDAQGRYQEYKLSGGKLRNGAIR